MNWLMENPAAIVAGGVIVELALATLLVRSGRGALLGWMLLAALIAVGLLVAERFVVTDSEAVRASLDGVAAALVANQLDAVLSYIDPNAEEVRQRARSLLPQFDFKEAHIGGDVNLKFHRLTSPVSATAQFNALFRAQERHGGSIGHDQALVRLRVELHQVDGRWLITDAEPTDRRF